MFVKRLKNKLLSMDPNTSTYGIMYSGGMTVIDPEYPSMPPYTDFSPIYYHGSVGFEISTTHKLAQDKPTVVISIPCTTLGIGIPDRSVERMEADFCLREFNRYIEALNAELYNRSRPDYENGKYILCAPGGEVICRNSAYFALCPQKDYTNGTGSTVYLLHDGVSRSPQLCLCIRMQVQFPRKKLRKTIQMMCRDLPDAVDRFIAELDTERLQQARALARTQTAIRAWLKESEYCAFVANGSILPRAKGGDFPMENAIPFLSAPEAEIEICGIRGMGIKRGVTVITGGGYSGKSTLLDAISAGIYDHTLGDGRELCITDESAVTISAEDGRSVKHVNISPFIKWIPSGDTTDFSTEHASGSTSQAANIMEAVDMGSKLLLIDEDRSATNFMIRDALMRELVKKEPITPFTERVRELYETKNVSTVLVIGGSGEYLSVADRVYLMEDYRIHNVSERAKQLGETIEKLLPTEPAVWEQKRILSGEGFTSFVPENGRERLAITDVGIIYVGEEAIDLRMLSGLITQAQRNAVGFLIRYLEVSLNETKFDVADKLKTLYRRMEEEGFDCIFSNYFTECERFMDLPRKEDVLAAVNRMRKVRFL